MIRKLITLIFILSITIQSGFAQFQFSMATDLSLLKSIKKDQRFFTAGQNIAGHFNYSKKDAVFISVAYYSTGKFKNNLSAKAKSVNTSPQIINFNNLAEMKIKQVSLGMKHYFKGTIDAEGNWNLYGTAGFGLLIGIIQNTYSANIDSTKYSLPSNPVSGKGNFKRLTLDLGLGAELPLGAGMFFYGEGRVWIPSTSYPSAYLFVNEKAPFVLTANFGIRILFN